jgi:hypothetical protein
MSGQFEWGDCLSRLIVRVRAVDWFKVGVAEVSQHFVDLCCLSHFDDSFVVVDVEFDAEAKR